MMMMKIVQVAKARKTFPTGDPSFAVMQAFPAGLNQKETDPFLMCDYFGPTESEGKSHDEDHFPIGWHPHTGMDICTYLKQGIGRHGDSMGNRETFETPGMQWISVGSGIEHAEGGGTPEGMMEEGFQLWFNTPASEKMKDPRYGTERPGSMPIVQIKGNNGGKATVIAGPFQDAMGPFKTAQDIQVIDFEWGGGVGGGGNEPFIHQLPSADIYDQCVLFVYQGSGKICGNSVDTHAVIKLNATDPQARSISFSSGAAGMKVMLFAGKQIKEPLEWRGPFVKNTAEEIMAVMSQYYKGNFPPKRVPWDYKDFSQFPQK